MVRYTGPATRKPRRLHASLVGGDTDSEYRLYPPGQAGRARIKESEYLLQFQEKQKARFTYGVVEKQFRRYYVEIHHRPGKTGDNPVVLLESRLDNVVYRIGLTRTRHQVRQLVSRGRFTVNGKKTNMPSFQVSQYDIVDVRSKSQKMIWFKGAQENLVDAAVPARLQVISEPLRIPVHQTPECTQIDIPPQEQLIVEFYLK